MSQYCFQIADRKIGGLGFLGMCPVVQNSDKITGEKVIEMSPIETVKKGLFLRVNAVYGSVRDEGSLVAGCK